jgi:hypothetical protein
VSHHLVAVPDEAELTELERLLLRSLNARGVAEMVNRTLDAVEDDLARMRAER